MLRPNKQPIPKDIVYLVNLSIKLARPPRFS
jgi:hypothetical protein